jgi:putative ABC transport system permease protein
LEASSFSDIRHISELEDVNEVKTQLCILFFLMLNIFWE